MTGPSPRLPLLAPRAPGAPLCWRHGQPVAAGTFLAQAEGLAARLPAAGSAVNLCGDRYHFALGFVAALLAGRPSLLPPDARPDTLALLQSAEGGVFALVDAPIAGLPGLHQVVVQADAEAADAPPVPLLDGGQHAASLLTSGSTGTPQPHAKNWRALWLAVQAGRERLAALLGRADLDGLTLVGTVPPQHSYGFESTVLLALLGGAAFDAGRPFFPADIVAALEAVPRPRALVTTPFHLKNLLAAGLALPPVDLVLSATAPLSPQLAARAEQAFGGPLVEIYGCTEAGQVATRRSTAGEWWDTFDGLRIRADQGGDGDPRFLVQGGHVAEPTPLADVLELRDERCFRLLGRSNDLIHVAGKRSSLGHLDFHLNSIPGVLDGAFWLPDEVADGVVRPVAFVVAPGLSATDIVARLRERLEAVFVPRRVMFVDSLPRVDTGKLTAGALRRFALSLLGAPAVKAPAVEAAGGQADSFHASRAVPPSHPAFPGHFPGQPLLPGALLLAEAQEVLAAAPGWREWLGAGPLQLSAAKFLAPVRPGDTLAVALQRSAAAASTRAVDFTLQVGATVVARGRWTGGAA